jgi:hypothetical protein
LNHALKKLEEITNRVTTHANTSVTNNKVNQASAASGNSRAASTDLNQDLATTSEFDGITQ